MKSFRPWPGAWILLLAFVLHGAAFLTVPMMEVTSDSRTYMMWATTLTGTSPSPVKTVCFHAPGYYWLMALLMTLFGEGWTAVLYAVQHAAWLLAAVGVWRLFAFWLAGRAVLPAGAAVLAACCSPSALLTSQRLMPDSVGASLSVAGTCLISSALLRRQRAAGPEFWAGCAAFALCLTVRTEKAVLLLPVGAALVAISGRDWKAVMKRGLLIGSVVSAGVLGPCVFNQVMWGRFTPALNGNKLFENLGTAGVIRGDEGPVTREVAGLLASVGEPLEGKNAWQVRAVLRDRLGIDDEYRIDGMLGETADEVLRARPLEYVAIALRNTGWQFAQDGMVPTEVPPPARDLGFTIFSPSPVLGVPVFRPYHTWYAHGFRTVYYLTAVPALLGGCYLLVRGLDGRSGGGWRAGAVWGAALLSQISIGFICTPYPRYSVGVVPFLFALWGAGLVFLTWRVLTVPNCLRQRDEPCAVGNVRGA